MSIRQDLDLLHNAAMSFGSEWPVGWDATAAYHRIKKAIDDEDRDHIKTIESRDRYHEVADDLTEAIASHFGQDFGEHSSANDPWANALNFLRNLGGTGSSAPDHRGQVRNRVKLSRCR